MLGIKLESDETAGVDFEHQSKSFGGAGPLLHVNRTMLSLRVCLVFICLIYKLVTTVDSLMYSCSASGLTFLCSEQPQLSPLVTRSPRQAGHCCILHF